ncbi:MAG: signal peptidase II [Asticcacaulis sp.]|nr:signal peptidase II [Asticcacaulis sp.]
MAAPMTKLGIRCLLILAVIVVLDQASKAWVLYGLRLAPNMPVTILPFFSFTYVQNTGMSFGLLGGGLFRWVLTLFQLAAGCALGYAALKQTKPLAGIALAFIAGGAIGNAIDRVRFGSVVDFIDFSGTHVFPWVFNIADSAITIGVALLAWYFLKSEAAAKDGTSPQG